MPARYELYLIRHGIAEERSEAWPDDSKRPLTDEGLDNLRKSARGLARLGVAFDVILTSPLVRTRKPPMPSPPSSRSVPTSSLPSRWRRAARIRP